jgi:hypothetical protein
MMPRVFVIEKENGFLVEGSEDDKIKEIVIEGKDAKKIGVAILAMFAAPRKPRVKRADMDKVKAGTA